MRCQATRNVFGEDRKRHEIQCLFDANHEGWHKGEYKNEGGTYKKTDVYIWPTKEKARVN